MAAYVDAFLELVVSPFLHPDLIWGIVPLYFGWLLNELTSDKASYRTAVQTGFAFIWAGAHWTYQYARDTGKPLADVPVTRWMAVNGAVTLMVLLIGITALVSGLRRSYPRYMSFLGHTRFASYFMIMIFPMQSNRLAWSWHRIATIALFALPVWLLMHFGFRPWRK